VALIVGSIACALWRRTSGSQKKHAWHLFGWLSLLVLLSSIVGIINSASSLRSRDLNLEARQFQNEMENLISFQNIRLHQAKLLSQSFFWLGVSYISDGLEVLFVTSAKLLVLERLTAFAYLTAIPGLTEEFRDRVLKTQSFLFRFIAACNLVGIGFRCASSHFSLASADVFRASVQAYEQGNTVLGDSKFTEAYTVYERGTVYVTLESTVEAFVLTVIVLVFFVVVARCINRVRELGVSAANSSLQVIGIIQQRSAELQLKMFGTTLVIFLSFLLHACFNFFVVSLNVNVTFNDNCRFVFGCPQGRCDNCQCYWRPAYSWLDFTPQPETAVKIVSGPVTLLVALWGMTNQRTRQALLSKVSQGSIGSEL